MRERADDSIDHCRSRLPDVAHGVIGQRRMARHETGRAVQIFKPPFRDARRAGERTHVGSGVNGANAGAQCAARTSSATMRPCAQGERWQAIQASPGKLKSPVKRPRLATRRGSPNRGGDWPTPNFTPKSPDCRAKRLIENDDVARHCAGFGGEERIGYVAQGNAARHHVVQVQLALQVELYEAGHVHAKAV